jgi:hypothetical protein
VARDGDTLALALCVELHGEGAMLPVLVLSDAPGVLGWDAARGLAVEDDAGRAYEVEELAQEAGLGALRTDVWIAPAPPPDARWLRLRIGGLTRTSVARGGGVERPLAGGDWELQIDLVPERTAVPVPPEPHERRAGIHSARVPVRGLAAFRGLVPIGQARVLQGAAVCLRALERYEDRAVLTVAVLADEPLRPLPLTAAAGRVEVWDDRGGRYDAAPLHGATHAGAGESTLELAPAIDPGARALGVRLADLPAEGPAPRAAELLSGPFSFGVALPPLA